MGRVSQQGGSFEFSFPPRAVQSSGQNFAIELESPDRRASLQSIIWPKVDDLRLAKPSGVVTIAAFEAIARDYVYDDYVRGDPLESIGYTVSEVFRDDKVGFYAMGLTSEGRDPILAIRGTETDEISDWLADFHRSGVGYEQFLASGNKNSTDSDMSVKDWLKNVSAGPGRHADIVGHSLGGPWHNGSPQSTRRKVESSTTLSHSIRRALVGGMRTCSTPQRRVTLRITSSAVTS